MANIAELLRESKTPLEQMNNYSRTLGPKWEKTGLLEGLNNDTDRGSMAVLLENQARQLLKETSTTNPSGAGGEEWNGVALPLVRKVFAELAAKEFVSVQPMNLPSGLIFYLDFDYGTDVAPRTAGDSVYGDTTSSAAPQGGLYGAGRFGYTINQQEATGLTLDDTAAATDADVNFEIDPANLFTIEVPLASLPGADRAAVRSFVPTGTAITGHLPAYTRLNAAQDGVIFVLQGTVADAEINAVQFSVQPESADRGDFEDRRGTSSSTANPIGVNLNIPEINIELRSEPVVAKTRKLKAVWTPELAQDLNAYHSVDAEAELTAILSEHIALEIDLEILEMLLTYAQTTEYWSTTIGRSWDGSGFVNQPTLAGQAWTTMTWYQTLGNKLQKVSNRIHQLTLRGGANFAVVSPDVATIIENIPGYTPKTDGTQASFAMGVTQVGSFQNRFTIYKNPYLTGNVVLMGFRGSNFLETGAVYAPYVPLIMTPLVYDPENFTPRRAVMTRYAKKMVRPEFYGKIIIEGLDTAI